MADKRIEYDKDGMEIVKDSIQLTSRCRYVGTLRDGVFHGQGCLVYSSGGVYHGVWDKGELVSGTYKFADGLEYQPKEWDYCTQEDRRFWIEILEELKEGEFCYKTNSTSPQDIPFGFYDTGDGLYDPETRIVTSYKGVKLRDADSEEQIWILANCRKGVTEDIAAVVEEQLDQVLEKAVATVEFFIVTNVLRELLEIVIEEMKPIEDTVFFLRDETVLDVDFPHLIVADVVHRMIDKVVCIVDKREARDAIHHMVDKVVSLEETREARNVVHQVVDKVVSLEIQREVRDLVHHVVDKVVSLEETREVGDALDDLVTTVCDDLATTVCDDLVPTSE